MSPGVLGFLVFIGMVMIIGIPVGIVMRRARLQTERARRPKVWAAGTAGAVGGTYYYGSGGGCGGGGSGDSAGSGGCGGGGCGGGGCGGGC
jgi:hypothetical protein